MDLHEITTTIRLGDRDYLVDPDCTCLSRTIDFDPLSSSPIIPVTVLRIDRDIKVIDASVVADTLASYLNSDDVISKRFCSSVVVLLDEDAGQVLNIDPEPYQYDHIGGYAHSNEDEYLRGPYFLVEGMLHKAYRLFPDPYRAFGS